MESKFRFLSVPEKVGEHVKSYEILFPTNSAILNKNREIEVVIEG